MRGARDTAQMPVLTRAILSGSEEVRWKSVCLKGTRCHNLMPVKYFDWHDAKNALLQAGRKSRFSSFGTRIVSASCRSSRMNGWSF